MTFLERSVRAPPPLPPRTRVSLGLVTFFETQNPGGIFFSGRIGFGNSGGGSFPPEIKAIYVGWISLIANFLALDCATHGFASDFCGPVSEAF